MRNASSITLCASVEANNIAQDILRECVLALENLANQHRSILSLILTGSFSRGEGSVFYSSDRNIQILGDMEFIAITKDGTDLYKISRSLQSISNSIELSLKDKKIFCSIEI